MASSRFWFIWWDPCGAICALFSQGLAIFTTQFLLLEVLLQWDEEGAAVNPLPILSTVLLLFLFGMVCWSHLATMLTDPGVVPLEVLTAPVDPELVRVCRKCNVRKPDRAHHCSTCRRCILRMDHHCPWMNNCIGQFNQKQFLLFLLVGSRCVFP